MTKGGSRVAMPHASVSVIPFARSSNGLHI